MFHFIYLLSYSSKRGKGGTKRLGLHKGTSQKTYIQLHSQKLPKLQNKTQKKTYRTFYKNTENNKYSHTHTKNKLHSTNKITFDSSTKSVIDNKLNGILFHMKGIFPKKEYQSELIVDCNGKIERECCLVLEDTKEQKSLNLTTILLLISCSRLTER